MRVGQVARCDPVPGMRVRVVHARETETIASPYSRASRTPISVTDNGGLPAGGGRCTAVAIRTRARLRRRAPVVAVAIEACAVRAGAAELLEPLPQLRAGAVERDAGVVGGHAERDRSG
jgi:hypothetical protein